MSPGTRRRRSSSLFGLGCGCKDSKSVSASDAPRRVRGPSSADTLTLTSPFSSTSSCWEEVGEKPDSSASTPRFSGLLRQLNELEENVMAWGKRTTPLPPPPGEEEKRRRPHHHHHHHRRSSSEGGRRIEESVAVVKESADPLGDFRRSMLQMIVEKEIVDGEELRELLRRFLSLNSPCHHDLILRAFAEIWEEVFSGYENTPDLLLRPTYSVFSQPRHF
ncbi:transcription repressor OFP8-like [Phoenix dactylifera]|uniref:Transcription repressor n=1 Tax=Phoenix dactylifera TaxID=42345 RepID=A0A8B7CSP2_PHODC|nr:transcription repressor OFP8-like [Phoenix dactylifera]